MVDCSVAGFRPCNEIQTGYVDDCLMSKNQVQDECRVHVLPDGMHAVLMSGGLSPMPIDCGLKTCPHTCP